MSKTRRFDKNQDDYDYEDERIERDIMRRQARREKFSQHYDSITDKASWMETNDRRDRSKSWKKY